MNIWLSGFFNQAFVSARCKHFSRSIEIETANFFPINIACNFCGDGPENKSVRSEQILLLLNNNHRRRLFCAQFFSSFGEASWQQFVIQTNFVACSREIQSDMQCGTVRIGRGRNNARQEHDSVKKKMRKEL